MFAGPDAEDVAHVADKDLAVAELAGFGRFLDHLGDVVHLVIADQDVELQLGLKLGLVLNAPIMLDVALLPPEPAHLGHGHPVHVHAFQGFPDFLQLMGSNDAFQFFHLRPLPSACLT